MIKRLLLVLIAIVALSFIYRRISNINSSQSGSLSDSGQTPQLLSGWTISHQDDSYVRIEKNASDAVYQIRPVVVLSRKEVDSGVSPDEYIDQLKLGAIRTLADLQYTQDESEQLSGIYSRRLSGYYQNSGRRVDFRQIISVNGATVRTITASFADTQGVEDEINDVIDYIATL